MNSTCVKQKRVATSANTPAANHTSCITMSPSVSSIRLMKVHLSVTTIPAQEAGNDNYQHLYSRSQENHFWFLRENPYMDMVEKTQPLSGEK